MSKTQIASTWRTGEAAAGSAFSFFDDTGTSTAAFLPGQPHQEFRDNLPGPNVSPISNRRQMPGTTADREEPVAPVTTSKKKTDSTSTADSKGSSKKTEPEKKSDLPPPSSPSKKPPAEKTPQKKPRDNSVKIKKNLPEDNPTPVSGNSGRDTPSPVPTASNSLPEKPVTSNHRPKADPETGDSPVADPVTVSTGKETGKIRPPQVKDTKSEPEPSDAGSLPPEIPAVGTASLPPDSDPEPEPEPLSAGNDGPAAVPAEFLPIPSSVPDFADEIDSHTPEAESRGFEADFLTPRPGSDFIGDHLSTDGSRGISSALGDYFSRLLDYDFSDAVADEVETTSYIPVVLPPPRNPAVVPDPVESFRAGYISQRDLEDALGREEWTMCCAATFVYAVQTKYPGLDREAILDAAGKAAETQLADGSGPCVAEDGYIPSIYQYSRALSENLGLKEYVDTSGQYSTVESAREAGAEMMKVELSGTAGYEKQEHHVLALDNGEIDPAPGNGISDFWDTGSREVVNVMAMDWYSLP